MNIEKNVLLRKIIEKRPRFICGPLCMASGGCVDV